MNEICVDPRKDSTIAAICRAVGYSGRHVTIEASESERLSGTWWDGGSRSVYTMLRLADMASVALPQFDPPQFGGPSQVPTVEIPAGAVLAKLTEGAYSRLEIFARPADMAPMLPAPVELTRNQRIVLAATRGLKSSYNGVSNYRFVESRRATGITLPEWDAAKAELIARGMLNKAGAITTDGRNAIGWEDVRTIGRQSATVAP